jgi:hypothetical protein
MYSTCDICLVLTNSQGGLVEEKKRHNLILVESLRIEPMNNALETCSESKNYIPNATLASPHPQIITQFFVEEIKYFNKICQLSATGTVCNKIKHLLEYYFFNKL